MLLSVQSSVFRILVWVWTVSLLCSDPATADHHDGIGRTGLMYAVHHTEHNALNFLLESRADVNATAHGRLTAQANPYTFNSNNNQNHGA